jgi:hypothetical protein
LAAFFVGVFLGAIFLAAGAFSFAALGAILTLEGGSNGQQQTNNSKGRDSVHCLCASLAAHHGVGHVNVIRSWQGG